MSVKETEILLTRLAKTYAALIPKRRGTGFLRVPVGHHPERRITDLEDAIGGNVFGLDGDVDLETHLYWKWDEGDKKVSEALTKCFGFPVRIVENDYFFAKHPLSPQSLKGENP